MGEASEDSRNRVGQRYRTSFQKGHGSHDSLTDRFLWVTKGSSWHAFNTCRIQQTKARRMTMKQRKEGKLLLFGKSNDEMKDGARIFNAVLFLLYHSGLSSGGHGLSSGRHTGSVVCKTRGGFRQMGKGGGREKGDAR
ncbi:hypothetical protein CISG_09226 [Coccidioides immitis RMSCC 3703]|uniref:Uncharacterized protein n=1 Tax=Coccidioides immitis RMSCC 3703 TaxID=454286 RepID=A0A0J8RCK1_COCIT|nr:hypothetical protein CISG_09226 [Coccidioides immitis RMSCC 3703]